MLDTSVIVDLINTIGFPIAMVIYFIWDKNKMTERLIENQKETMTNLIKNQNETTKILSDTLNSNTNSIMNNTIILEKLLIKLGAEELRGNE